MQKEYLILIVDDDKFLVEMYKKKFVDLGMKVEEATSPLDALEKLRQGLVPDVLVSDIIMPGMDGIEFIETIRKENLIPQTTIIMLTNENDSAKIEKAKSLGVAGYIIKATTIPSEVADGIIKIAHLN